MRHYLSIALCMLIWSTWGLMIRWIALPPVVVLFYTCLVAGIGVPLFLRIRGTLRVSVPRQHWWIFGTLIASSITNNLTYFYALGQTTISNAVFTHYTAPLFVALLAPFLIQERLQRITLLSLPVAVSGMMLIVLSGGGLRFGGAHSYGIVAGTVSGVAYALLIIYSRQLSRMLLHNQAVVILLWTTAALTAPYALSLEHHLTPRTIALFLVTGLVHSSFASLLYYHALKNVIAQHAAILGYVEPLSAVPLAFLFLSETPAPAAFLGWLLILFSGFLVMRSAEKERQRQKQGTGPGPGNH